MVGAYLGFLALVALQRMSELALSRRNARWARACGGVEVGQRHYPFMKLLHTSFLIGCAVEAVVFDRAFDTSLAVASLLVVVGCQAVRWWTIRALGPYWNTRVLVVPGAHAVTAGPYRWLKHPNYAVVVLEGIAIPMIAGAWITALAFTLANALLLRTRIRCEEAALSAGTDYAAQMRGRGSLLPRPQHDTSREPEKAAGAMVGGKP